jgi:outer membrane receptor protein involved in Fe transport
LDESKPTEFWTYGIRNADGSDTTYFSANQFDQFKQAALGLPDSLVIFKTNISAPQTDPLSRFFDSRGFVNSWRDDYTRSFTFKGDITSQIHSEHLIKMGAELQYHDIQYIDIQDGGIKRSLYGEYLFSGGEQFPEPNGPFPEFGQLRWVFDAFPWVGGAYIQDKFEKETLILNVGFRVDWLGIGPTVSTTEWRQQWENATGLEANWRQNKFKLSPRFGISFPISERTVTFFSYGHFNQLPELQFLYRDPYTGGFTGNPNLDYEQTVLYEFGFTHQLTYDWAVDIKSYAKDISQQVGTTRLRAALGLPVDLYDNNGYSRARGLEFQVIKRHSNYTNAKLTYTVQWANGFSSSAFEDYIRSINDFPNPIRERRLSWDIRHQIIFQGALAAGKNEHPGLFGLKLPDQWNITVLARFFSGDPYTAYTTDPAVRQVTENLESGPIRSTTDLKISKTFDIYRTRFTLFADIFNLFDERNTLVDNPFYRWFNTELGDPYRYGQTEEGTNKMYDWYPTVRLIDPRQFNQGRQIKLGFRIDW